MVLIVVDMQGPLVEDPVKKEAALLSREYYRRLTRSSMPETQSEETRSSLSPLHNTQQCECYNESYSGSACNGT